MVRAPLTGGIVATLTLFDATLTGINFHADWNGFVFAAAISTSTLLFLLAAVCFALRLVRFVNSWRLNSPAAKWCQAGVPISSPCHVATANCFRKRSASFEISAEQSFGEGQAIQTLRLELDRFVIPNEKT
jgi:hypothetical protein